MADLTHGAVDSLLGLLSAAVKDEARLLGGVHRDVQFIKDEMDSMNGFLMHLTKMEGDHDDQLRAWMKQVRDIAYVAEDCIELYRRDLMPADGDGGLLARLRHLPVYLWTVPARHRLANRISELKARVREVGERRMRYDVRVPEATRKQPVKEPGQDKKAEEARLEDFRRALEDIDAATSMCASVCGKAEEPFSNVIDKLPAILASDETAKEKIRAVLCSCRKDSVEFGIVEMFLYAMSRYPYATPHDLDVLVEKKLKAGRTKEEVMVFCYSKLSTQQKSCLQYLTAFLEERSISRTSIVRRWVAEGLVGREQGRTLEEAGERCFSELLSRRFVRPKAIGDSGTVRSCIMDESIREFIVEISKSENFVFDIPSHLARQLRIREIVLGPRPKKPQADHWSCNICTGGASGEPQPVSDLVATGDSSSTASQDLKEPMDKLVDFLKELPKLYRLNVLDLGGCQGVKKRHLKSICKVAISLKYLCLRNTDISRLPARHIQALRLLETLDIRETNVRPTDTKHIFLPNLKHLLAGRRKRKLGELDPVRMPLKIGRMRDMETLSHVQVSDNGAELADVSKLMQLRKLGLVLHGNDHEGAKKGLCQVLIHLVKCLRSLSIWVSISSSGVSLDMSYGSTFPASSMVLENLEIKGQVSLPYWIVDLKLLTNVTLIDTQLKDRELQKLGKLQGLRSLRLGRNSYSEQYLTFHQGQDEFKGLKFLVVECDNIARIVFAGAGVAPSLEKIVLDNRVVMDVVPFSGIEHLPMLKAIELRLIGDRSYATQLMELEGTIAALERRPYFRYSFPDKAYEDARPVVVNAEQ